MGQFIVWGDQLSSLFVNCSQIGTQFDWSTNQLVPQFRKIWRSLPGPMDAIFVAQGVSEFIRHSVGDFCSSTRLKFWEDCIALGAFYKPLSINIIFVIILPVKDDLLHKTFFGCKADFANTLLDDGDAIDEDWRIASATFDRLRIWCKNRLVPLFEDLLGGRESEEWPMQEWGKKCSSGWTIDSMQCTMCTCGTTIPLYTKLPCICYRGIIEFQCIFAGFWRYSPEIL